MARCASERRAEGEVNSYRNAAGIGRTIFNRVVILLTSGSCRLETNSDLAALSEREIGSDSPVDCHVSERRAEGKRRSAASGGSSKPVSRKCPNGRATNVGGHWQTRRGQRLSVGQYPTGWSFCLISSNVRNGGAGEGVFCRAAVGLRTMVGNGIQNVCWVGQKFFEILPN